MPYRSCKAISCRLNAKPQRNCKKAQRVKWYPLTGQKEEIILRFSVYTVFSLGYRQIPPHGEGVKFKF